MNDFTRALIIDQPWVGLILANLKPWEMRSRFTKIRGRIGLIEKGTGLIVGSANLHDCLTRKSPQQLVKSFDKHRVDYKNNMLKYQKWCFPWVLKDVVKFEKPIKYHHPQGAVIWVKV